MIAKKFLKANLPKKVPQDNVSTARQCRVALDILRRLRGQKGVLLADDAGLGKTWTAALVALNLARNGGRVLILVPNSGLLKKWERDLATVRSLAEEFHDVRVRIQARWGEKWSVTTIKAKSIVIATHAYFGKGRNSRPTHTANLLIVDEAHRSKGGTSKFKNNINSQGNGFDGFLFLTATPFSIHVRELCNLIDLVSDTSCEARSSALKNFADFAKQPAALGQGSDKWVSPKVVWDEAINQLRPWVIRHTIDDLAGESESFGIRREWLIDVGGADTEVLETLARTDRLLNLNGSPSALRGSDPRFHVGWHYLSMLMAPQVNTDWPAEYQRRNAELSDFIEAAPPFAREHARKIRSFLSVAKHQKIERVAQAIMARVAQNEKVVVFCHHHATMRELSEALYACEKKTLFQKKANPVTSDLWRDTWESLLRKSVLDRKNIPDDALRVAAMAFVCADSFRVQVWPWLDKRVELNGKNALAKALSKTRVRGFPQSTSSVPTILEAVVFLAKRETHDIGNDEKAEEASTIPAILKKTAWQTILESEADDLDADLALFNTPFGPDVLVATDKLSEGIDLQGCCRSLVHYELDPSPVRVRQREGRIRRIGSWAGRIGKCVEYAYPTYDRTRDKNLVDIVKGRLNKFDLLLGGAPEVVDNDPLDSKGAMLDCWEELANLVGEDVRGCLISPL